jgi:hypothetical protein
MLPEEDLGRPIRKSGAVTAVAIVNFIMGGLNVICGVAIMIGGALGGAIFGKMLGDAGAAAQAQQQMNPEQAKAFQQIAQGGGGVLAGFAAFLGICIMILAVPTILAGVGVMNRRQWGRILTLILGALAGLGALGNLRGLPGTIPAIIVGAGYCVFVYVILLNKEYAAEFR